MVANKLIKELKKDVKDVVRKYCSEKFDVMLYGAYHIDPKHLVVLITVNTDNMKKSLSENDNMGKEIRTCFVLRAYPSDAIDKVIIWIESQETVDRESNGDWWLHMK